MKSLLFPPAMGGGEKILLTNSDRHAECGRRKNKNAACFKRLLLIP
ncbi:MAG: hypothetical protein LBR79_01545 [Oscillospiraceae bacterium]|nr:hypothetical protein [Oscillospiraceae bacterium]